MPGYPKHPRAYVTFQVRLPPDLKRQLEEYAYHTGQSQIAVVTAALEAYLPAVEEEHSSSEPQSTEDLSGGEDSQETSEEDENARS